MAKADYSRNLYADLGVQADADDNDIRRAFRQLALKYHPDRNPGRETEVTAKFQQIQAAHEILSDRAQRIKYDNERRKYRNSGIPPYNPNAPRTRPQPSTRNTYSTPSNAYYRPPPPKPPPQNYQPPPPRPPPPPQYGTSYATGADRFTSRNFRAPPTAKRADARPSAESKADTFTAWQKMKPSRAEPQAQPKPSNPNNPNGAPFGRSQSTRTPSGKKGFDPASGTGDEGQARSSYRSNYDRPMQTPPQTADSPKHFKSQAAEDIPYAEGNRVRTPYYSTASGERTNMFGEGLGRSASVRNSPTHSNRGSTEGGSFSDSGRRAQRNSYGGSKNPFPGVYPDTDSSSESEAEVFRGRPKKEPRPRKPAPKQQTEWGPSTFSTPAANTKLSPDPPNPFKSKSEESINMKFSPSDWNGTFQGQPDYFAPNMANKPSKGRASPTRGRQPQRTTTDRGGQSQPPPQVPPFMQSQTAPMPPPPPPPPLNTHFPPPPSGPPPNASKFTPEAWHQTFKDPSFAYPVKETETSPRRGSTNTKRPKAPRKQSATTNGVNITETGGEQARPKYQAFAEETDTTDGDAMDIDPDTSPASKSKTAKNGTRSSRTQRPRSATATNGTSRPLGSGIDALAGLQNLQNVEPFASKAGLTDFNDFKQHLPFQSQPSNQHPKKPNTAQKLKFPHVPKAPAAPDRPDRENVKQYFTRMQQYVRSFREYNRVMTAHFASRDAELDELDDHFIHNYGETSKKLGFSSYMHRVQEDDVVLETWKTAQDMHMQALRKCQDVRALAAKFFPAPAMPTQQPVSNNVRAQSQGPTQTPRSSEFFVDSPVDFLSGGVSVV